MSDEQAGAVHILFPPTVSPAVMDDIRLAASEYPGPAPVIMHVASRDGQVRRLRLGERVLPTTQFTDRVAKVLARYA